jgi:diguanylate cyclase (GGDEF)-like protein
MDTVNGNSQTTDDDIRLLRKKVEQMEALQQRCDRAEQALSIFESRNKMLGEVAPFGIFTLDQHGNITGFNSRMSDLLPWPSGDPADTISIFEFEPLGSHPLLADVRKCLADQQPLIAAHSHTNAAGKLLHLRYHISPIPGQDQSIAGVMAFVENISSLKLAEDGLKESEEKFRLLFEHAPIAMIERNASELKGHLDRLRKEGVTDFRAYFKASPDKIASGMRMIKTTACNQACLDLFDARDTEEVTAFLRKFGEVADPRIAMEIIQMIATGKVIEDREDTFYTLKGKQKSVLGKSMVVSGYERSFARIIIALVDISRRKQVEEALKANEKRFREQSLRDNLTKLYNRRYLYQSLTELIDACPDSGSTISLLFIDLDDFKQVVDTHGHINGSQVIKEVAATIREALSHPEFAVAYAGDEFVVVLPDSGYTHAQQRAADIQARIAQTAFLNKETISIRLSASIGAAAYPDHANDLTELLAAADRELFAAKEKRKSRLQSRFNKKS